MQTFSPAQNPTEAWQTLVATVGLWRVVALFAGGIVIQIVAAWVASLCLASERATLGRAVKLLLLGIVVWILVIIGAAVVLPLAIKTFGAGAGAGVSALLAFAGIALAIAIGLPMVVYEINLWRGVGFFLLQIVIGGALQTGLQFALVGTLPFNREQWQQVAAAWAPPPKGVDRAEIEKVREELRERQTELARRHAMLEIRRKYLPVGSSKARDDYERERAAYDREVEQLRMEASALPPPQ